MKKKVLIIIVGLVIIVCSLGITGLYLNNKKSDDLNGDSCVKSNNKYYDNLYDSNWFKEVDYQETYLYVTDWYECKSKYALDRGKIVDNSYGYKAILYENQYYFYYNDEITNVGLLALKNSNYNYYVISNVNDSSTNIIFSTKDNKFIGKQYENIDCIYRNDYNYNVCYSNDYIITYENNKYYLMSLENGNILNNNAYNYIVNDYNGNFIVSDDIKLNGYYELLDNNGNVLIKNDKQYIMSIDNGNYLIIKDNNAKLFDESFNEIKLNSLNNDEYSVLTTNYDSTNYIGGLGYCKKGEVFLDGDGDNNFKYMCSYDQLILSLSFDYFDNFKESLDLDSYLLYSIDIKTGSLKKLTINDFVMEVSGIS